MRHLAAVSAVLVAALLAPAQAAAGPRAVIAFLPAEEARSEALLDEFARRDMAVGLLNPTVGGYTPEQAALDIGQGARVPTRLYDEDLPALRLARDSSGGRIEGWAAVRHRAAGAPGDVEPGLLAASVLRAGGSVGYAGASDALGHVPPVPALVAAGRDGRIQGLSQGPTGLLADRALGLLGDTGLVVVELPAGPAALSALDDLLRARAPEDLVIAMRAPPAGEDLRLLPIGAAGPGLSGKVRSDTTRRAGYVAATDIAPTVLARLGAGQPEEMSGQPIEAEPGDAASAASEVRDLGRRLEAIPSRRGEAMRWLLGSWLLALLLAAAAAGRQGARAALRSIFLAALWMPGVALLAAALDPSRAFELLLIAGLPLALGVATDRLVRWPLAPALPAAVVFVAHAVDLAAGSAFTALSLAGPSPKGGARFFGVGNELEVLLGVGLVLGAGAALTLVPARRAPLGFGLACLAGAVVLGAGRLGADVGAVIMLGAGAAAAMVLSLPGGPSRRAVALAVGLPVAALGGLVLIDVATGGGAHFTRSVIEARGADELADVAGRRLELSWRSLRHGLMPVSVGLSLVALAAGFRKRREVVAPLDGVRGRRAFIAGLGGALAATVVGALANDSGPTILVVGTILLLLAAGYVQGGRRPAGVR